MKWQFIFMCIIKHFGARYFLISRTWYAYHTLVQIKAPKTGYGTLTISIWVNPSLSNMTSVDNVPCGLRLVNFVEPQIGYLALGVGRLERILLPSMCFEFD